MKTLLTNQEQIDRIESLLGEHIGVHCGGSCTWATYYKQRLELLKRERTRLKKLDEFIELERVRTG